MKASPIRIAMARIDVRKALVGAGSTFTSKANNTNKFLVAFWEREFEDAMDYLKIVQARYDEYTNHAVA